MSPEAGQGQPAGKEPGCVGKAPIQVCVELGYLLIQHGTDLLPVETVAGRQDDQLRKGLKQI